MWVVLGVRVPTSGTNGRSEGKKGTQMEIAEALGIGLSWVKKWDPVEHWNPKEKGYGVTFYGYNVWGFKDESWRQEETIEKFSV